MACALSAQAEPVRKPLRPVGAPPAAAPAKPEPVKREVVLTPKNTVLKFEAFSRIIDAEGIFKQHKGKVVLSGKDLTKASIVVAVKVTSIDTANGKRDKHLRTGDFFNVSKWPNAVFTSTKITKQGGNKYRIDGKLKMMGKVVPINFLAKMGLKGGKLKASADFYMDRTKWGMTGYLSAWSPNPIRPRVRVFFTVKE